MPVLEKDIEGKVTAYAIKKGCIHLKLNVLGRRGWPDHIYIYYKAKLLFIEYKLPGEKPEPLQRYIHGKLKAFGFNVEVIDTHESGYDVINRFTKGDQHL